MERPHFWLQRNNRNNPQSALHCTHGLYYKANGKKPKFKVDYWLHTSAIGFSLSSPSLLYRNCAFQNIMSKRTLPSHNDAHWLYTSFFVVYTGDVEWKRCKEKEQPWLQSRKNEQWVCGKVLLASQNLFLTKKEPLFISIKAQHDWNAVLFN